MTSDLTMCYEAINSSRWRIVRKKPKDSIPGKIVSRGLPVCWHTTSDL